MSEKISAIGGAFFPRLPAGRPVQRFADHLPQDNQQDEQPVAQNAYANPLFLPPGSSDIFAASAEEAGNISAPLNAFSILRQDFLRLEPEEEVLPHALNAYA